MEVVSITKHPPRRCGECGLYFRAGEGIGHVCAPCYIPRQYDNTFDPFAYARPVPMPLTEMETKLSAALTETEHALYFLYEALERLAGPKLPARDDVERAIAIFKRQWPELVP